MRSPVKTSPRLHQVRYEIRGELARRAHELEAEGRDILRLNIGNPGRFGFRTPEALRRAVADGLDASEAYCHQKGLEPARQAVAAQQRARGVAEVDLERIFIGNGVSELIDLALRALLETGDEVLVPAPDYPLWTASVLLNGGRPLHYPCRPEDGFLPDPEALEKLITPRTRALVLINPNNPTGAVYPAPLLRALVELARRHGLVLLSDEIYDGLLFDDARFVPVAPLAPDLVCLSFGGLSKVWRACGYRVGWVSVSGPWPLAADYLHALELLSALRLCGNVTGQWAVAPALGLEAPAAALTAAGGRLFEARQAVIDCVAASPYLDLVAPMGALYAFPGIAPKWQSGFDDHAFALELLEQEGVLVVPGSSFNFGRRDHFRITLLPEAPVLREVFRRIDLVLARRLERASGNAVRAVAGG